MNRHLIRTLCAGLLLMASGSIQAVEYLIDTKGAHAFIQFHIKHLGYSWLVGRFNTFSGSFEYVEKNPDAASITVDIEMKSDRTFRTWRTLLSNQAPADVGTWTVTAGGVGERFHFRAVAKVGGRIVSQSQIVTLQ